MKGEVAPTHTSDTKCVSFPPKGTPQFSVGTSRVSPPFTSALMPPKVVHAEPSHANGSAPQHCLHVPC